MGHWKLWENHIESRSSSSWGRIDLQNHRKWGRIDPWDHRSKVAQTCEAEERKAIEELEAIVELEATVNEAIDQTEV